MAVSDIPFPFQFAGVRVGRVGGQYVANPSEEERAQSDIDVIMAANRDSIFMVEGGGKEVSEPDMIEALLFGQRAIEPLLQAQEKLGEGGQRAEAHLREGRRWRKAWRRRSARSRSSGCARRTRSTRSTSGTAQLSQIKKDVVAQLCAPGTGAPFEGKEKDVKQAFEDLKYDYMRRMITHEGKRIGGRALRRRSAPSPARWACCRARTARRSSPAARRRAWSPPRSAPPTTSSGWRASRDSPSASSCCTTTSPRTRWAR